MKEKKNSNSKKKKKKKNPKNKKKKKKKKTLPFPLPSLPKQQPRLHRPPPLQLLPDALQASADTVVLPHPSLMSRSSGGGGGGKGGSSFSSSSSSSLRAPAHYPSSYLTALAPPPALALSLLPRALSGALLKKKDKKKNSSSEMQLSLSESVGAALGSLLALSVAAAAGLAAALGDISLVSAPRRLVPRAEVLAGAQLLALAALAPPPHLAAELVGVARAVVSGKKDFAAADSAAAVENSLLHLLIFSSPASDDNTSRGVFPLKQAGGRGLANYFPLTRLAICGLQLWSLLFLWLPATVLFPAAARAAAAALDASFASAAGAAAARAEEAGGPLSHWRDGKPGSGAGEEVKKSPAKIPELAREYWRPPAGAGMRTVLLSARADAVARALVGMASINPHTANPVSCFFFFLVLFFSRKTNNTLSFLFLNSFSFLFPPV